MFYNKFYPDVDAIYITDKNEIQLYLLNKNMKLIDENDNLINRAKKEKWMFQIFKKRK